MNVSSEASAKAVNAFISFFQKNVITPITLLLVMVVIIAIIYQLVKIAASPTHPMLREIAMRDIASNIITFALIPLIPIVPTLMFWQTVSTEQVDQAFDNPMLAFFHSLNGFSRIVVIIHGLGIVTSLLIFIVNMVKLAGSGDNPQKRAQAVTGLLWAGLAIALLGGLAILLPILMGTLG